MVCEDSPVLGRESVVYGEREKKEHVSPNRAWWPRAMVLREGVVGLAASKMTSLTAASFAYETVETSAAGSDHI